jgi:hypothetical protein
MKNLRFTIYDWHPEDFGVRWQSAATTPFFDCGQSCQSGVALRFPPQSKQIWLRRQPRQAFRGLI